MMRYPLTLLLSGAICFGLMAQQPSNPFATAKRQDAPDREYDLQHVSLRLNVESTKHRFSAEVENTLAPLRDGLTSITIPCGQNLRVNSCAVSGQLAACEHQGDLLTIRLPHSSAAGQRLRVLVKYASEAEHTGFHWIEPDAANPQRVGFFTEWATAGHPFWLPTWNYPNDFVTSETWVTVPADWYVVANGALRSDRLGPGGKTRTFHWQMVQPHATYLISLASGPFDIQTDSWRGVPLMYIVPKGQAGGIASTFGETPEMLSFYSNLFKLKFPWPKYAQTVLYDYSNNMEWVSATSFSESLLSDGKRNSSPIIAHELVHQWFGDLVTCKDWGDLWLNEGFAFYFGQMLYTEHWRGKNAFDHSINAAMGAYFEESRRYERPLSTRFYPTPGSLFDTHTYSKGALILHMLRRRLGDELFFRGIHHYLTKYQHTPVETHDFSSAMTEATGIDLTSFFDEWVYQAGHPILDYVWEWNEKAHEVALQVKQLQDVQSGRPLYSLSTNVASIVDGQVIRQRVNIAEATQTFSLAAAQKPEAVLLDPDHDFIREIPTLHWSTEELPHILAFAPSAADRESAMNKMLEGTPSTLAVEQVVKAVREDRGEFPALRSIRRLGELQRPELRSFFREQLANPFRRVDAVSALVRLPRAGQDVQALRALINDREDYFTIAAVVSGLAEWDAPGNRDVFTKAAQLTARSPDSFFHLESYAAIAKADIEEGKYHEPDAQTRRIVNTFLADAASGNKDSLAMTPKMCEYMLPSSATVAHWLKDQSSLLYLLRRDAGSQNMRRRGANIDYVAYFKMITGRSKIYLKLFITPDGKIADWQVTWL